MNNLKSVMEFNTVQERNYFIDTFFPERECYSSNVPGFYKLGNGNQMGILMTRITFYYGKRVSKTLRKGRDYEN